MGDESVLQGWSVRARSELRLPRSVQRVLDEHMRSAFPRATPPRVRHQVERLSDMFTAERDELRGAYLNQPPVRSAYLAYVHPLQVMRGIAVLLEVRERASARGLWPVTEPLRVLDVGAGLGAMTQALLLARPPTDRLEVTLVDHQKSALRDARALTLGVAGAVRGKSPPPLVRTIPERVERWTAKARRNGWRYDVVLLGGVLNEGPEDWRPVVEPLLDLVADTGLVVIMEPALGDVARSLMTLRDGLLGRTTTIAPCTHGAACPLLTTGRDWCFTVRPALLPKPVAAHADALGHQTRAVRCAFWAFAPRSDAAPLERPAADHGRIVTEPMQAKQVVCVNGHTERPAARGTAAVRGDLATRVTSSASRSSSS